MSDRLICVKKLVCVSLWLIVLAACSSGSNPASGPTPSTSRTTVPAGPSTTVRRQPVSARIELTSASMGAGSSETGYLVIENNTGTPLRLTTGGPNACRPKWAVVLANTKVPQVAAFAKDCAPGSLAVRTGETRLPFTLHAVFQACSSSGQAQGALVPACLAGPQGPTAAPPLPPDLYEATFFGDMAQFPHVMSVPVRVLPHI